MSERLRSWAKRAWEAWHHIDALRGLVEAVFSLGAVAFAAVTYGAAVISIVVSVVLVGAGWLAVWGPYVVAPVAIAVATVPNYLMWRSHKKVSVSHAVSPSENLILVSPVFGAEVTCPFEVRGYANAMEGNIIAETKNDQGEWYVIAIPTGRLGNLGELFLFSTEISLGAGKRPLRVCAEPFMADERSYQDCVEIEITVL